MGEKLCKSAGGALLLLAGLAFLGFGLGALDGSSAHLVAGGLIAFQGVRMVLQAYNSCPLCNL